MPDLKRAPAPADFPFTCKECGATEEGRWIEPARSRLLESGLCFVCDYWQQRVHERDRPERFVTPSYQHFTIGGEDQRGGFRGHAGRRFRVHFFDGRTVETTNLWSQSTVPERWRDRLPPTARLESLS